MATEAATKPVAKPTAAPVDATAPVVTENATAETTEGDKPRKTAGRNKTPWTGTVAAGIEPTRSTHRSASGTTDEITFPVLVDGQDRTVTVKMSATEAAAFLDSFDAVLDN